MSAQVAGVVRVRGQREASYSDGGNVFSCKCELFGLISGNSGSTASSYSCFYCPCVCPCVCVSMSVCVSVCVCAAVKAGQAVLLFAQVALTPRNRVLSTVGANGPSYRCCWGGLVITPVVTVTHTKIQPHTHT